MPVSAVDHLEAAIARLTTEDLAALPPARLQRLADAAYRAHLLAEQAAGQKPFPRVQRKAEPKAGVLADLGNGQRTE